MDLVKSLYTYYCWWSLNRCETGTFVHTGVCFSFFVLFFVSPCLVLSVASWGSVSLAVSSSSWEWRFLYSYERYCFPDHLISGLLYFAFGNHFSLGWFILRLRWVIVVPKKLSFALVGCLNETLYWPIFCEVLCTWGGGRGEGAELHHFTTSSNLQSIALLEGTLGKPPPWGFTLNEHNLVSF
jgi:hypothetical protein